MKVKLRRAVKRPIQTINIVGEFIRLDALLKFSGLVMTGGESKQLILDSLVMVNGVTCTQRGKKIHPGDTVVYGDVMLKVISLEKEIVENQT